MSFDCALCQSLDESYRIIHKDDLVVVIVNIEPVKEGHLMVMPVRHAEQPGDLSPEESRAFLQAIDRCMLAVRIFPGSLPCVL